MIRFDDISNIYLFTGPTDLRKGIDGYAAIVENEMGVPSLKKVFFFSATAQK